MNTAMKQHLKVRGLSKTFVLHIRGKARIVAFTDLGFDVEPGKFLGVTGPNGAGKSSLLRCVYGTYRVDSGEILYRDSAGEVVDIQGGDEHEILRLRRDEISSVTQFFQIMPRVGALGIVTSALLRKGIGAEAARERAVDALNRVGLRPHLHSLFPSTFSGGEKQRLNIALAVASRPRFLIVDEPTASLDAKSKDAILELLADMKAEGVTMMGVFHDRRSLERLADEELSLAFSVREEVFA
jgi:alpha-D-ribose 1-methylphosphonate 5-triphosphate synthase subunit PhnL